MVNKKDEKEFAIVPACPTMVTSERRQGATGARSPKRRISSMLPVAYSSKSILDFAIPYPIG
jgi:hypothetical protein